MSDRLAAICLALLLAAPLCYVLDSDLFEAGARAAGPAPAAALSPGLLSIEDLELHAEGLQRTLAAN
jgi:hypothetical protein